MASISKRPDGSWRARYRGPDGRERAKHFRRKADAEQFLARTVVQLADGRWVDPARSRTTFGEYAQQWYHQQVHYRASTADLVRSRLERWILPTFDQRPLVGIMRSDVQAWVRDISEHLAPRTVRGCYRLMASVMLSAVEDRLIPVSPCRKVNLPETTRAALVIPSIEEVAAVAQAAPAHAKALVWFAAGTGLRFGEMAGLQVADVDFLRRQVEVRHQLVTPGRGAVRLGPLKTRASHRTIPIPAELAELVAAHLAERPSDGFVWRNGRGGPWRRNLFSGEWARWCRHAGVGFTFHHLRHFYASALISAGQSVKVVQARLGHSSASTTLDVYGHLFHDDEDRTREVVAGLLTAVARTSRGPQDANMLVSGVGE